MVKGGEARSRAPEEGPSYTRGRDKDGANIELTCGECMFPKTRYPDALCYTLRDDVCAGSVVYALVCPRGCHLGPRASAKPTPERDCLGLR